VSARPSPGPKRLLDGILLLDKPVGPSSSTALLAAKRLLGAKKAGHAGTLDPQASGLLPLLFGEATKFAQYGLDSDKEYLADIRLGITTDSGDAEGRVLETRPVRFSGDLELVLEKFRGPIQQIPPMHSALKRDGRPLYELAREGKSVERAPRPVRIDEFTLLGRDGDTLKVRIRCSKGTYIRQLAADLGETLGCGAHLTALRRSAVGALRIEEAVTLDMLQDATPAGRDARLLPLDRLLEALPRLDLDEAQAGRFANGQAVHVAPGVEGACRVYGKALLGIGEAASGGRLQPLRMIARR
jgi:tRNA pseudouridine55 synthase